MGKVLQFRKAGEPAEKRQHTAASSQHIEDEISAIVNDHSLTPSNRRWILENMLMNMDDQLEEYKRELDQAERKLDAMVKAAEREIAAAYLEFDSRVRTMTRAVKRLTNGSSRAHKAAPREPSDGVDKR